MHLMVAPAPLACGCPAGAAVGWAGPIAGLVCARHALPCGEAVVVNRGGSSDALLPTPLPLTLTAGSLERVPVGSRLESHGRFLWYRTPSGEAGSVSLPPP